MLITVNINLVELLFLSKETLLISTLEHALTFILFPRLIHLTIKANSLVPRDPATTVVFSAGIHAYTCTNPCSTYCGHARVFKYA